MSIYKDIFFPTTNAIGQMNESTVFLAMVVVAASSILYIIFGIKHLMLIFKNRDNSLRQNTHIIFKILIILFLSYVIYEIANIILEMS